MRDKQNTQDANFDRQALEDLKSAVKAKQDGPDIFAVAERAAQATIGHRLFTIMAFHADSVEVERLYSSNPDAYPPGGRKEKRDTAWGRLVLDRGEPYIGCTASDIRANFNDHEVILGLGLESVLNVPIKLGDRTVGTLNLLHDRNYYKTCHLAPAMEIAGLLVGILKSGANQA